MARIAKIAPGYQSVDRHPTEVDCYVQVVDDEQGRLVHLSTFGSASRSSQPKSSQSMQFDRESARELVTVLVQAFGEEVLRSSRPK